MKLSVAIFLGAFLGLSPAWAGQAGNSSQSHRPSFQSAPSLLSLGPVINKPVIEGCTCEFQQSNAGGEADPCFVSEVTWDSAWIHVDHKDVSLKREAVPERLPDQKGQKTTIRLTGPQQMKVDLDLEVSHVCPASELCDTVGFEGTMIVNRGPQKAVARITGACGC